MFYPNPEELSALWISFKVSAVAVGAGLPFAIALGYWLARTRSAFKGPVELIVSLPLVLPPVVVGYILLVLFGVEGPIGIFLHQFGIRITFTWFGAALAAAVVSFPLMSRSIRTAFAGVDPRFEMAARTLGARKFDVFWSVSLPLAFRGVVAGAVLAFGRALGEFGATIMVAGNIAGETRTVPVAIYSLSHRPGGLEECWRMVVLAILLAAGSLAVSELIERRRTARDLA